MALTTLPERFPIGLRVLALDFDTTHHPILHAMGNRFQYQVTTCCMPSVAFNLLSQTKSSFDLIIVDTDMQELTTAYDFLEHVLLFHQIPVIFMSSRYSTNSVMEAITKGASDYWIKPLEEQYFQMMWKHVLKGRVTNKNQNMNDDYFVKGHVTNENQNMNDDYVVKGRVTNENQNMNDDNPSPAKKFRWSWTQQLHDQFVTVVNELGIENAKPKRILKIMDVPGLTRQHIASHLQKLKYKLENGMKKRGRKQKSNSSVLSRSVETHSVFEPDHTLHEQHSVLEPVHTLHEQEKSNPSILSLSVETRSVLESVHTLHEKEQLEPVHTLHKQLQSDHISDRQQHLKKFCNYDSSDIFYDLQEDLSSLIFEACPPEVDIFSLD